MVKRMRPAWCGFFFIFPAGYSFRKKTYIAPFLISYHSQWESRHLNRKIELGEISASKDPLWKNSGATSPEEYEKWSWNLCAVACLKMVAKNFKNLPAPFETVRFAKQAMRYGSYVYHRSQKIEGIFWKEFQQFLRDNFTIKSRIVHCLSTSKIAKLLRNGHIVFLSVSPLIHQNTLPRNKKRSGHIVVAHGFQTEKGIVKGLFIKDPGGWSENETQERFIDSSDLARHYSGRGFVISLMPKQDFYDIAE